MPESEEEQLFRVSGASGAVGEVLGGPTGKATSRNKAKLISTEDVAVASPAKASDQPEPVSNVLDDGSISADRTFFDDLLRQRIIKVNRVSADVSKQLDALKAPS